MSWWLAGSSGAILQVPALPAGWLAVSVVGVTVHGCCWVLQLYRDTCYQTSSCDMRGDRSQLMSDVCRCWESWRRWPQLRMLA